MKRKSVILTAVLLLAAFVLCCAACGQQETLPNIKAEEIYGVWSREISTGTETYTFFENMKYSHDKAGAISYGTYSISGATLTLENKDTKAKTEHSVRIAGDTMTWGSGGTKAEYTRVDTKKK